MNAENRDLVPDGYLWDKRAPADPEISRLEALLAGAGHRHELPAWPDDLASPLSRTRRSRGLLIGLPLAAALVAALALWRVSTRSAWTVATTEGAPAVNGAAAAPGQRLAPGQWLMTDDASRVHLLLPRVGEVEIGPGSRVGMLADRRDAQALRLERGSLLARTWAPPRLFSVDTPAGRAVDYGCAYALEVDAAGVTRLRVEMGWVALEVGGREALVPAGASLRAGPSEHIGTPVWLDAPRELRAAVERLDLPSAEDPADAAEREAALTTALTASRARDALTLWHLLASAPPAERPRIYDALAKRVPIPSGVDRQAAIDGDRRALRTCFVALGLGEVPGWN
jgi:hypothetical protein